MHHFIKTVFVVLALLGLVVHRSRVLSESGVPDPDGQAALARLQEQAPTLPRGGTAEVHVLEDRVSCIWRSPAPLCQFPVRPGMRPVLSEFLCPAAYRLAARPTHLYGFELETDGAPIPGDARRVPLPLHQEVYLMDTAAASVPRCPTD